MEIGINPMNLFSMPPIALCTLELYLLAGEVVKCWISGLEQARACECWCSGDGLILELVGAGAGDQWILML